MKMFKDGGFFVSVDDIPEGCGVTETIKRLVPNVAFFRCNKYGWWGRVRRDSDEASRSSVRSLEGEHLESLHDRSSGSNG